MNNYRIDNSLAKGFGGILSFWKGSTKIAQASGSGGCYEIMIFAPGPGGWVAIDHAHAQSFGNGWSTYGEYGRNEYDWLDGLIASRVKTGEWDTRFCKPRDVIREWSEELNSAAQQSHADIIGAAIGEQGVF